MKHYVSKEANCPYYHMEERQKIYCEGVEEQTSIHLNFPSPTHLKKYAGQICYGDWENCRIAQMLNKKWDDM